MLMNSGPSLSWCGGLWGEANCSREFEVFTGLRRLELMVFGAQFGLSFGIDICMYLRVGLGVLLAWPKLDQRLMLHNLDHSRT